MRRTAVTLVLLAVLGASCSGDDPDTSAATTGVDVTTVEVSTTATTTVPANTSATIAATTTTIAVSTTMPTTIPPPAFVGTMSEIDDALAARMTTSWRDGCPVALGDLRYLQVAHWDYDGQFRTGELVVHADWAEEIVDVFRALFDARFPIQQMRLIDDFGGSDPDSMAANNTSAFNCREVAYRPGVWSNHAYGLAIDINPLVNPYVDGSFVDPPEGALYADRSVPVPGGIYPGDAVTAAFASIGWTWGGDWSGAVDYQHFSANGR